MPAGSCLKIKKTQRPFPSKNSCHFAKKKVKFANFSSQTTNNTVIIEKNMNFITTPLRVDFYGENKTTDNDNAYMLSISSLHSISIQRKERLFLAIMTLRNKIK